MDSAKAEIPEALKIPDGARGMVLVLQRTLVGEEPNRRWADFTQVKTAGLRSPLDFLSFSFHVDAACPDVTFVPDLEGLIPEGEKGPGNGILVAYETVLGRVVLNGSLIFTEGPFSLGLAVAAIRDQAQQQQLRAVLDTQVPGLVARGMVKAATQRAQVKAEGAGVLAEADRINRRLHKGGLSR